MRWAGLDRVWLYAWRPALQTGRGLSLEINDTPILSLHEIRLPREFMYIHVHTGGGMCFVPQDCRSEGGRWIEIVNRRF